MKAKRVLIGVVFAIVISTGILYAAYVAFQSTVEVTVEESLIVTFKEGDCSWDIGTKVLSCNILAGSAAENIFTVSNIGSGELIVTAVIGGFNSTTSCTADPAVVAIAGGKDEDIDVIVTVAGDAPPGDVAGTVDFARE